MQYHTNRRTADGKPLYPNYAIEYSHPDRLAMLARLHGIPTADVENCRVLELGCAGGGNLLPMAELLPDSEFVGIDMQPEHIEDATNLASKLDINNVHFETLNILDACTKTASADTKVAGEFDYILCHGVFSWAPPEVQHKILDLCNKLLAKQGIAYINLNTLPGWTVQSVIKEYLQQATAGLEDTDQITLKARESLGLLQAHYAKGQGGQAAAMREQLQLMAGYDDGFLFHAYLDAPNYPIYFRDFCERLSERSMQYICDSHQSYWSRECELTPANPALPSDRLAREQQLDFFQNRGSRYSLIAKSEAGDWQAFDADAMRSLYISGVISEATPPVGTPADRVGFRNESDQVVAVNAGTASVLSSLADSDEGYIQLANVIHERGHRISRETIAELLHLSNSFVRASVIPPQFSLRPTTNPMATKFARYQASIGQTVTSIDHRTINMPDTLRNVLCQMDGTSEGGNLGHESSLLEQLASGRLVLR